MAVKAEAPREIETIFFSTEGGLTVKQEISSLDFRDCKRRY